MIELRFIRNLLIVFGGSCLLSALLTTLGLWILTIFTSIGFGVAAVAVSFGIIDEKKKGSAVIYFIVLIVATTTGFMASFTCDEPFWPYTVSGITVNEAAQHPWATVYYFRDAQVRDDLVETAEITGASGAEQPHRIDMAFVAPVVSKDWTPDQPIKVWAVGQEETFAERSKSWKQPHNAGVRITGIYNSDYLEAIQNAKSNLHLKSIGEPIFLDWTTEPNEAIRHAWSRLGIIAAIGIFIFLFVIIVGRAFQR